MKTDLAQLDRIKKQVPTGNSFPARCLSFFIRDMRSMSVFIHLATTDSEPERSGGELG